MRTRTPMPSRSLREISSMRPLRTPISSLRSRTQRASACETDPGTAASSSVSRCSTLDPTGALPRRCVDLLAQLVARRARRRRGRAPGAARRRRRTASSLSSVTPRSRACVGAGERREAGRKRLDRHAGSGVQRRQPVGEAAAQRGGRVRQHVRVGGAVPGAADAHERLRAARARARTRRRRSRSPTAAPPSASASRSGSASSARPPRSGAPPRARRAPARARSSVVSGASTACASALALDAASSGSGCEAHSAGSLMTIRGRTRVGSTGCRRARGGAPTSSPRPTASSGPRRRALELGGDGLRGVDDAPAAERDDQVGVGRRRSSRAGRPQARRRSPSPTSWRSSAASTSCGARLRARAWSSAARSRCPRCSSAVSSVPRPKTIVRSPSRQVKGAVMGSAYAPRLRWSGCVGWMRDSDTGRTHPTTVAGDSVGRQRRLTTRGALLMNANPYFGYATAAVEKLTAWWFTVFSRQCEPTLLRAGGVKGYFLLERQRAAREVAAGDDAGALARPRSRRRARCSGSDR